MTKEKGNDMSLEQEIEQFLKERGVLKVGFANLETLSGGPPSADLTYLLPDAQSAVSFALPLDREAIRLFLSKKNQQKHVQDNIDVNRKCVYIARDLADWLVDRGYKATIAPPPGNMATQVRSGKKLSIKNYAGGGNEYQYRQEILGWESFKKLYQYRQEIRGWRLTLPPKVSHSYIAVRSGVASYGWSGCVGIKGIGATIILGSVITSAKLKTTESLSEEDNFCDNCKLCISACPTRWMERDKEVTVTLGGQSFTHSARKSLKRCQISCGGFSGLDISGKWSTWSPGRLKIPDDDKMMLQTLARAFIKYKKWPKFTDDFKLSVRATCANCQLICFGNRKETAENYRMLVKSGCVVQNPDGSIVVLPPEEAEKHFHSLPKNHRRKYTIEREQSF